MTNEQIAQSIIKGNRYLCLATASSAGLAWASPVSYCTDSDGNFYFQTSLDCVHVENIRTNPEVSAAIYDSQQGIEMIDGLQMRGVVGEVEEWDVARVYDLFVTQVIPASERSRLAPPLRIFTKDGGTPLRFFQFVPTEMFKKDLDIKGVARRVRIDLEMLRALKL